MKKKGTRRVCSDETTKEGARAWRNRQEEAKRPRRKRRDRILFEKAVDEWLKDKEEDRHDPVRKETIRSYRSHSETWKKLFATRLPGAMASPASHSGRPGCSTPNSRAGR